MSTRGFGSGVGGAGGTTSGENGSCRERPTPINCGAKIWLVGKPAVEPLEEPLAEPREEDGALTVLAVPKLAPLAGGVVAGEAVARVVALFVAVGLITASSVEPPRNIGMSTKMVPRTPNTPNKPPNK